MEEEDEHAMDANEDSKEVLCHSGEFWIGNGHKESEYPPKAKHYRQADSDQGKLFVLLGVFLPRQFLLATQSTAH